MCPYLIAVQGSFRVGEQKPQVMYVCLTSLLTMAYLNKCILYVCPTSLLTMAYFAPDYQTENNQR